MQSNEMKKQCINEIKKQCINEIKKHSPPDVYDANYANCLNCIRPSLNCNSHMFCDNIILWSIKTNQRVYIQKKCKEYFDDAFELKMIRSAELKDDDIAPAGTSYYCFKISLSEVPIRDILFKLRYIVCEDVILHDIDIAQDIKYITTRKDVRSHILKHGIHEKDIINDRSKVGDHCISFYDSNYTIKIKVYNKFVQMLESCDVMTVLGSRLHSLFVDPSPSFRNTLLRTKKEGLTRIEVKFYASDIYEEQDYISVFNQVKEMLQGCIFYKSSFDYQWKQLVDNIYEKQVIMIHLEDENFFAYCHWWNSLTGKMQGGTSKVHKKDILQLISNYSFNGMATKLIRINGDDITVEEYRRTISEITLVPGPRGGLYPQTMSLLHPEEVGLVEYKGVKVGWSNNRITKESASLTRVQRISADDEKITEIVDVMISHYKAAYSALEENCRYKVISKGQLSYRGEECTVIEVVDENSNMIKVRCGPSLEELVEDKTLQFWFETDSIIRNKNCRDMLIK
jgi:hypothetical protein